MNDAKQRDATAERSGEQAAPGPDDEMDTGEEQAVEPDRGGEDAAYPNLPQALLGAIPEEQLSPAVHEVLSELDGRLSGRRQEPEPGRQDEDSSGSSEPEVPPPLRRVDEAAGEHSGTELIRMGYGRG